MDEISLSTDLNVLTAEINSYKQIAGQSIWEIGRRLNYVKENDLAHGEFIEWVNSLGMDRTEAFKFMKVANELPNVETLQHLGNTALYLITQLPEEEREKEHVTSKGETKTPDEMTVRELQELKKQLKAKDEQIKTQAQIIDNLSEQEPEVIEKEVVVEKMPSDYERLKRTAAEAKELNEKLDKALKDAEYYKKELSATISLNKQENGDAEQAKLKRLQRESDVSVYQLIININNFVKEQAVTIYDSQAIHNSSEEARKKLTESVERAEKMLREVKKEIGGEVAWIINN